MFYILYIPDNSEQIASTADKIKQEGAQFHDYFTKDGLYSWFERIFGEWGTTLLRWISVGLLWIVVVVVLVKCTTTTLPTLIFFLFKEECCDKSNGGPTTTFLFRF